MTRTLLPTVCLGAIACVALLAGCHSPANTRLTLGSTGDSDQLGSGGQTLATFHAGAAAIPDTTPSLHSTDRTAWGHAIVYVPVDRVVHHPTYRFGGSLDIDRSTARHRHAHPTAASAADLGGSPVLQAQEAVAAPFLAAAELITLPVRFFMHPAWSRDEPAYYGYERYRGQSAAFGAAEPQAHGRLPR